MSSQFLYLTTVGRRTGSPHRIEIWFASEGGPLYLISGGGNRSDWVKNLLASPHASVELDHQLSTVGARLPLPPSDERTRAVDLLHAKYADQVSGTRSSWQREAFIVALDRRSSRD
jgi:deazaflavin-dependent oxidoreductase (nitroreductase family)